MISKCENSLQGIDKDKGKDEDEDEDEGKNKMMMLNVTTYDKYNSNEDADDHHDGIK